MFIASLVFYLLSTFLLVPLFYSSFIDTSHIHPHTFLHPSLLLTTSNFLSSALLSFISLYVQLLVHYGITRLFLLLTPHPSVYTPFFPLTPTLSLPAIHVPKYLNSYLFHLFYYSNYFFVLSSSYFYFFLLCLLQLLLLLFQLNYESISLLLIFDFYYFFLLILSSPVFYLVHLLFPSLFQTHVLR